MPIVNAYENAPALCEAIISWQARRLPPSLEKPFYDVLQSIAFMATALLIRIPKFRKHSIEWKSFDIQAMLVAHLLGVIRTKDLELDKPKAVVNYLLRSVQNRLRDLHAYQDRRKDFVVTTGVDLNTSALHHSDIGGEIRRHSANCKINTTNNRHKEA